MNLGGMKKMSLKDYSVSSLLAEIERRTKVDKGQRITNTDLSEYACRNLSDLKKGIEKDRSLHTYSFSIVDDICINVEYRYIITNDDVETVLESIEIEFPFPAKVGSLILDFQHHFFAEDLLEDFFWDHLHDDLPPVNVSHEDIEDVVKDVQDELDILESEAYDIVHRSLEIGTG
jgi:hypothetical protein